METREKRIIQTSIIGILANLLLAAFKAVVGILSHSVAVVLDAVNNLSDALSSLITIVGTKLASRAPDKKHPLGHGRIEYFSALAVAVIILYAGVTSLVESVKKIIRPETPDYSARALIIIAAAVLVKIVLGTYVKKVGKEVDSDSLTNSGSDALFDAVISLSTLVAAVIFLTTGLSLEAWLGAVISVVIIKSGVEMLQDTISELLGKRITPELSMEVKGAITSFPDVSGAYDLIIHNYGPGRLIGSVHIAVPDTMTADRLDLLEREITQKVFTEHGVAMTGISIYSENTRDEKAMAMRDKVAVLLRDYPHVLQMHGFYVEQANRTVRFDLIVDFDTKDRMKVFREVCEEVQELYPDYKFLIALDYDISD